MCKGSVCLPLLFEVDSRDLSTSVTTVCERKHDVMERRPR